MPADQFAVFCERHVAFDDAGAHAGGRQIGLSAVFGELHRGAAVADGKVGLPKGSCALAELLLQRPVLHLVDQVKRPRPDLRFSRQGDVLRHGGHGRGKKAKRGEQGGAMADRHGWHLG